MSALEGPVVFPKLKVLEGALTLFRVAAYGNNCLYVAIGSQVKIEAKAVTWQEFKSLLELPVFFILKNKG